ncbi:Uncharacterized HTH-type transcriptional regulator yurK [Raoultella terrigena]|uniref:Uncharacterized HTH-type transcriptional regulator yurK n=1 Tax=Raoultella terrigena TaxID=577 RepID=A0A4U9DDX4_RAOTE|nr:Uncharacterized HTH-type transcriptional regulator yurK [Raoultella terrigena]
MASRRFGTQSLVRLLGNWQESASRTPLWRQLAEALRLLILDGRLTLETRLPGERELATALSVSRTTIASALGQLREEGYLYSRQGSGSRIALPQRQAGTVETGRQRHVGEPGHRRPQRRAGNPSGLPSCAGRDAPASDQHRLRSAGAGDAARGDSPPLLRAGLATQADEVMMLTARLAAWRWCCA